MEKKTAVKGGKKLSRTKIENKVQTLRPAGSPLHK